MRLRRSYKNDVEHNVEMSWGVLLVIFTTLPRQVTNHIERFLNSEFSYQV